MVTGLLAAPGPPVTDTLQDTGTLAELMALQIFMALESAMSVFGTPGPLITDALMVTGLLAVPGPPVTDALLIMDGRAGLRRPWSLSRTSCRRRSTTCTRRS